MNNFIHTRLHDKRKAKSYTAVIMIFFLSLLLLPLFSYQDPPPGQPGLLVSFGDPEAGQGQQIAENIKPAEESAKPSKPVKTSPPKEAPKEKTKPQPKEKPKEVKTPIDEKVIAAKNEAIALQKQEAKEKADEKAKADAQAKAESNKKAQELAAQREAERIQKEKEKAAELAAAAKAAEAEKAAKATSDFKNALTDAFGKGDGGKSGNQGDPNGDPNADALKGLSTGSGRIGGGLSNRGGSGPVISDNSNKTGTVVVKVCINASGAVQTVSFTQKGSTTQDASLIKLAVDNARKWSFNSGIQDETCGTITYDFKVK